MNYLFNNGFKAAIRFSVTLKGKELYDMCRVFDGKEPLKKGIELLEWLYVIIKKNN